MPIVSTSSTLIPVSGLAVPLPRYAQIIAYSECSLYGVNNPSDPSRECRKIWSKPERDEVVKYLLEAQEEIEQECGFPLLPTWIADEERPYSYPVRAKWTRIIEAGVEGRTNIQLDAAVSHLTDPAVVTVATTVTDEDEIRVYYPASLGVEGPVEISPSDIDIAGGVATISIPRCRMVLPTLVDNDQQGVDYTTTANFLQVVDVVRVYNDPSTHATLVWPHTCSGTNCNCPSCGEDTQDGCIYIRDGDLGYLDVLPGAYASGAWSRASATCCNDPCRVRLNYRAGMTPLTWQAEDAIVRLAHSKMPEGTCFCDSFVRVWRRDRETPTVLTRERINCPFGLSNGAWAAWRFTRAFKKVRGATI